MSSLKYSCPNKWNKHGRKKVLGTGSQNSVTYSMDMGESLSNEMLDIHIVSKYHPMKYFFITKGKDVYIMDIT